MQFLLPVSPVSPVSPGWSTKTVSSLQQGATFTTSPLPLTISLSQPPTPGLLSLFLYCLRLVLATDAFFAANAKKTKDATADCVPRFLFDYNYNQPGQRDAKSRKSIL